MRMVLEWCWVSDLLLAHHLDVRTRVRGVDDGQDGDVDAEGLARHGAAPPDLLPVLHPIRHPSN